MISLKTLRNIFLISLIINPLIACSQGGEDGNDLLQLQAHLEVAELYREQGQFRASIIELQNAFQLASDNEDAMRQLASIYIEIGDVNGAIELLKTAYQKTPENPETILLLSKAYLATGKLQDAADLLDELELSSDGGDTENVNQYHFLMATLLSSEGNVAEATTQLQTILDSNASDSDALILLSKLEYQAGNVETATTYLNQAIDGNVDSLDLWIWRGQFSMLQADYPVAEDAYYEALDIMSLYDIMTAKKFAVLQSVIVPLQMQQKDSEALRFSALIASTPQGEFNSSFSNAVSIFQDGDMAGAEQALSTLLASAPNHPGGNILLGVAKYAQGNFTEAEALLSNFVDIDSASPQLIQTLVATHLRLNEPAKAISILDEAIKNYPEDGSLLSMRGLSYQALGNPEESNNSFNKALELEPDSAAIHIALASNYQQMGNISIAIDHLNQALELAPNSKDAKQSLLNIHIQQDQLDEAKALVDTWLQGDPESALNNNFAGIIATRYEDFTEARGFFARELELDPNSSQAILNLARIDMLEENYSDAEDRYKLIVEQDVNNATALGALLAIGELTDSLDSSIAYVQKIITDNPLEYVPPLLLSQYYFQSGDVDSALQYSEQALNNNDNVYTQNSIVEISTRQAGIEAKNGNFEKAQSYIDRIQQIQPNAASSYEIEGDLLMAQDKVDSAVEAFQFAWSLSATSSLGTKLFRLYSRPDQDEDAFQFLSDWVEQQPESTSANLLIAMGYQSNNQESQAIEHYENVYQQQPENLVMLNNLAWMYQETQPERALELASRAAALYPENADVLDTYGWILFQQGNRTEGITALEQALELSPESDPIIEHLNIARNGE